MVPVRSGLFSSRSFLLFWLSMLVSRLASEMGMIAVVWFTLIETGSATTIGAVIGVLALARLLSSALLGPLLDRYPQRMLLILDHLLEAFLYGLIPLLFMSHSLNFGYLLLIMAGIGLLSPLTVVGNMALLPSLVLGNDLSTANAAEQVTFHLAWLFGPAVGGILVGFFGAPTTVGFVSLLLLFAGLFVLLMGHEQRVPTQLKSNASLWSSMVMGYHFLRVTPVLWLFAVVSSFFGFAYGPMEPALPVLVKSVLHGNATVLGLLWSSFAVGSMAGIGVWQKLRPRWRLHTSIVGMVFGWGVVALGVAMSRTTPIAMFFMFLGGFVYAPYSVLAATLRQQLVPEEKRGAVFGLFNSLSGVGFPTGLFLGGFLVPLLGPSNTIAVTGYLSFLLVALLLIAKKVGQTFESRPSKID